LGELTLILHLFVLPLHLFLFLLVLGSIWGQYPDHIACRLDHLREQVVSIKLLLKKEENAIEKKKREKKNSSKEEK